MTARKPNKLRLVAFDIDGVFTDGRFYLSDDGVESKCFNTQDGYGIRQLLKAGIVVAVISGRASEAVSKRMAELDVKHVILGSKDKVASLNDVLRQEKLKPGDCAYVGDDVPDLPLLNYVGYAVAVANAVPAVHSACDYSTAASGGYGAVREVCELVLAATSPK